MEATNSPCPRCGQPVEIVIHDPHVTQECGMCGERFRFEAFTPYNVPDALELENGARVNPANVFGNFDRHAHAAPRRDGISDFFSRVSDSVPAAKPTQPKDPDKALTSFALGMFRFRGWPCRELEGYRSFEVRAGFKNPATGLLDVCRIVVSARGGVLTMETIMAPLPLPELWFPVRATLNEINARTGGSVLLLCEEGIVLRNRLIARPKENGTFSERGILQALRQLNHDRRLAFPIVEGVLTDGEIRPVEIVCAFAEPAAPNAIGVMSLAQLRDLAEFAGYFAVVHEDNLCLAREAAAPEMCPVRMAIGPGVMRSWAEVSYKRKRNTPSQKWDFVKKVLKNVHDSGRQPKLSVLGRLLERLNVINEASAILRLIWNQGTVLAMNIFTPAERELSVEEFRSIAEALLRCAQEDSDECQQLRRAV